MDPTHFERFARLLGAAPSRRQIAALLGNGLAAALLGRDPKGVAARKHNKHKQHKKKCRHGKKNCGRQCIPKSDCCRNGDCASGNVCIDGRCVIGSADCPADADSCSATGTVPCTDNHDCNCFQRLEGGVRCVQPSVQPGACDQCETDADCLDLGFPPGSTCFRDDGPNCTCDADQRGVCAAPCGSVPARAPSLAPANGPRR
jgi:hypothetical protein